MSDNALDEPSPGDSTADDASRRRRRQKNNPATTREITAIPPTTPPAMAPAFELCPPVVKGVFVAVLEVELPRTELEELEELGKPGTWPGSTSGLSIKARCV